jgi:hypothetical protein
MSNIGDCSKLKGGILSLCGKLGGLGAPALKKESCIEASSASASGGEEDALEGWGLAEVVGSGGLSRTIESATYQYLSCEVGEEPYFFWALEG